MTPRNEIIWIDLEDDKEINKVKIEEGDMHKKQDECLIDSKMAEAGVKIGDYLTTGEVLENILHEGSVGTPYSTSLKEFSGYEAVTNKKYYTEYKHPPKNSQNIHKKIII